MAFTITVSGSKTDAQRQATEQSDHNIAAGIQSEAQKVEVLLAVSGAPGVNVSGSIVGYEGGGIDARLTGSN